jgi:ubiquinone/menaquinone biosynthesis C-methylase UbiE
MASLYNRFVLPGLLKCACSSPGIMKQRAKVVPLASGRVLELGIGMGLNLALYDGDKVESVTGVDPAPELRAIAEAAPRDPRLTVRVEDGTAEDLPFEDASFDCVVCTFTLCSVQAPAAALAEARRVSQASRLDSQTSEITRATWN